MNNLRLSLLFCLALSSAAAQTGTIFRCPSSEIKQQRLQDDPVFKHQNDLFEQEYVRRMTQGTAEAENMPPLYTVPVVVHIIHSGEAVGTANNPSDATITTIINQATGRFRHTSGATFANNPFSGMDAEIEFCLAQRTPGNAATTGVVRYNNPAQTAPATYASMVTYMNGLVWDPTKYANLFLLPTSPADFSFAGVFTGTFTAYETGIFWSGLVAHEMGHYFNLDHTFDGGCPNNDCLTNGDRVCDTPPKATAGFNGAMNCATPNNGCATDDDDLSANNPFRPVGNGGIGDRPDGLENYMDYTGSCWAAFTQGQVARMRTNIQTSRVALVTGNNACTPPPLPVEWAGFQVRADQKAALLTWQTATEKNTDAFEVLRSRDALTFETIGRVTAAGNSANPKNYGFNDDTPYNGRNYYRIKQIDSDGKNTFSEIKSAYFQDKKMIRVFPTLATDQINISADNVYPYTVLDQFGRPLISGQTSEGLTSVTVGFLPKSVYLVRVGEVIFRFSTVGVR